jgi:hypothetical protein
MAGAAAKNNVKLVIRIVFFMILSSGCKSAL